MSYYYLNLQSFYFTTNLNNEDISSDLLLLRNKFIF